MYVSPRNVCRVWNDGRSQNALSRFTETQGANKLMRIENQQILHFIRMHGATTSSEKKSQEIPFPQSSSKCSRYRSTKFEPPNITSPKSPIFISHPKNPLLFTETFFPSRKICPKGACPRNLRHLGRKIPWQACDSPSR